MGPGSHSFWSVAQDISKQLFKFLNIKRNKKNSGIDLNYNVLNLVIYAIKYQYTKKKKKISLTGMHDPSTKIMGMFVLGVKIFHRQVISSDFRMESMQYIFSIKIVYEQILIYT